MLAVEASETANLKGHLQASVSWPLAWLGEANLGGDPLFRAQKPQCQLRGLASGTGSWGPDGNLATYTGGTLASAQRSAHLRGPHPSRSETVALGAVGAIS